MERDVEKLKEWLPEEIAEAIEPDDEINVVTFGGGKESNGVLVIFNTNRFALHIRGKTMWGDVEGDKLFLDEECWNFFVEEGDNDRFMLGNRGWYISLRSMRLEHDGIPWSFSLDSREAVIEARMLGRNWAVLCKPFPSFPYSKLKDEARKVAESEIF